MASGGKIGPVKSAVSRALIDDSSVAAIVDGRIHTRHFEDDEVGNATYPLAIISFRSGLTRYNPIVSYPVFEIWCYSRLGQGEATDLYDLAKEALQAERLLLYDSSGVRNGVCVTAETQQPTEGYNSYARAWFAQGRWVARTIGG